MDTTKHDMGQGHYDNLGEYIADAIAAGIAVDPQLQADWDAQVQAHNAKCMEVAK